MLEKKHRKQVNKDVKSDKFAVRKPVTIIMCLLTIAYFGIQSLLGTKVELTPEMEFPMLVVSTVYAGASLMISRT